MDRGIPPLEMPKVAKQDADTLVDPEISGEKKEYQPVDS